MLRQHAEQRPDAPAVISPEGIWSYARLLDSTTRIAAHLRGRGVEAGTRVGVSLERGPWMLATLLGISAAGGTYVPLDMSYPNDRLAYMAGDSGITLIVGQTGSGAMTACDAAERITLEELLYLINLVISFHYFL